MSENRRRILEMTAEGKLSAEEAERLLSALDEAGNRRTAVWPRPRRAMRNTCVSWSSPVRMWP